MKFVFVTTGSGYQLEQALQLFFFRENIFSIVSNTDCRALLIGKKNKIRTRIIKNDFNKKFNEYLIKHEIDYVLSQNNRIIFDMEVLHKYKNKIFNLHNSILPAFKGTYSGYQYRKNFDVSKIFENQIEYGSLVMGVTIHIVTNEIDNGYPVLVSIMNRPYYKDLKELRHLMFIKEVALMLQLIKWIYDKRFFLIDKKPIIKGAEFKDLEYTPNLDSIEVIEIISNLKKSGVPKPFNQ